jgi:hypothetical protein
MTDPEATTFDLHLREQAPRYFADFSSAGLNVQLVDKWVRPASIFYRFDVESGSRHRFVLVKVPLLREQQGDREGDREEPSCERPLLVPMTDPAVKFEFEHAALTAIQDYFEAINDPRFGTIRILDVLPEHRAIVMEEVSDPSLRRQFVKASRLRPSFTPVDLNAAFQNAGAWLRAYHALPRRDQATCRHTRRVDFLATVKEFAEFLAEALDDEVFFQDIVLVTTKNALKTLPETLPLGLGHGDCAMRNILVGPNNRVTIIDTLAKWRTSIYEDIAYFLTELKTNRLQVLTLGLAFGSECLDRYEREFLVGYFGRESIPYNAVRLYEVLLLLSKWSFHVPLTGQRAVGKYAGATGTLRLALMNRFFRKSLQHLVQDVEGQVESSYAWGGTN